MMEYVLQNERVRVTLNDFGAEMTGLSLDGFPYLWTPDAAHYDRVSPCIFPIMGRFMDGYYLHNGQKYVLPLNGFAMNKTFKTERLSDTELTFTLTEDEETLAMYPFRFELAVRVRLEGAFVHFIYTVTNRSAEPLPFGIGNHTAYRWPLSDGDDPSDYFVRFEQPENFRSFSPFGWTAPYLTNESVRPLHHGLYINGTRSTRSYRSAWLEYTGADCDFVVRTYHGDFPALANWAKPDEDARLVCLEPSLSISSHGPTLFDREGIHVLPPATAETVSYSLELYRKSERNG